uniref:CRIB domain-containing protein n=1 Tax=Anas platyrhynchos TaxID=8839 RepID=A0A8B9STY9_ANAPL
MSLGKLPVLSWVSGSHGKRRLKSELTPDMISPPLGDFRHTMHVGRGGDVFGDTSFLSNHGGSGFCTIPRVPRLEKAQENTFPGDAELARSDSLLSFRLDLGPSLMSELLQVMSFSETNGAKGTSPRAKEPPRAPFHPIPHPPQQANDVLRKGNGDRQGAEQGTARGH